MRRNTPKRAAADRRAAPVRRAYLEEFPVCQRPGCHYKATEVHEIARGPARAKAYQYRECWLALCRECHEEMGGYGVWPLERQLAVKMLVDYDYFNLLLFNWLRSRGPEAVTVPDVLPYLALAEEHTP